MKNRSDAFLDIVRCGLIANQEKKLAETLGDRSAYIGLSDLAKYSECPRAAIAAKLNQVNTNKLLTLSRGHWFEAGIAESFNALGLNMMRQLEISHNYQNVLVKGHLDLTLVWDKPYPAVRIVEIKSMEKMPDEPYQNHQWQVAAQTALLKYLWNKPVFSEDSIKNMTFPQLCSKKFIMKFPDNPADCSVEGWLLCLSMNDIKAFGPFNPDPEFMQDLNIQAMTFWQQLEQCKSGKLTLNNIPHAQGFYPLCSYCEANRDCPKFSLGEIQNQWEPIISRLDGLKDERSNLDGQIKEIESGLKIACQNSEAKDWISTGNHRFKVISSKGRTTLDRKILEAELENLFRQMEITGLPVSEFLEKCEKVGVASERLTIQNLN